MAGVNPYIQKVEAANQRLAEQSFGTSAPRKLPIKQPQRSKHRLERLCAACLEALQPTCELAVTAVASL